MNKRKLLNEIRERRRIRARAKIFGVSDKPRLTVFRSNRYTYVQLIDDENGNTLVGASTRDLKSGNKKTKKAEEARELGALIAKKAAEKGIKKAVFSRRGYKYHGRIKAVAEGARKGGLQF